MMIVIENYSREDKDGWVLYKENDQIFGMWVPGGNIKQIYLDTEFFFDDTYGTVFVKELFDEATKAMLTYKLEQD